MSTRRMGTRQMSTRRMSTRRMSTRRMSSRRKCTRQNVTDPQIKTFGEEGAYLQDNEAHPYPYLFISGLKTDLKTRPTPIHTSISLV